MGKYFLHKHTHNLKVVGSNPTPATKAGSQKLAFRSKQKSQSATNLPQTPPQENLGGRFLLAST